MMIPEQTKQQLFFFEDKAYHLKFVNNKPVVRPKHNKIRFTPYQDELLKALAEQEPHLKWSEIAEKIPGKTSKQCRDRYSNFLSPLIQKEPWTVEEDGMLVHLHHFLGCDWAKIATFFPGRTNNDVKNRYNYHLKKRELDAFLDVMMSGKSSLIKYPF